MNHSNKTSTPVVLVVDDDDGVRRLVSAWLAKAGYAVLDAPSGRDAIQLCSERNDIALLVTDICMPEMDGFVLAERLAERYQPLLVIYMTGYCEATANVLPGSVWMRKPLQRERFLSEVHELLPVLCDETTAVEPPPDAGA